MIPAFMKGSLSSALPILSFDPEILGDDEWVLGYFERSPLLDLFRYG